MSFIRSPAAKCVRKALDEPVIVVFPIAPVTVPAVAAKPLFEAPTSL